MDDEEKSRLEFNSRSHFNQDQIKEIMAARFGPSNPVSEEMTIVVSSLAKMFVGELAEIGIVALGGLF